MAVDFDGASRCYGPHGIVGALDALANAGHAGNWWGVVTNTGHAAGQPIVQSGVAPAQPDRGFYISQTSLIDPMYPIDDVRRYTDATKVPYVALPPAHMRGTGLRIGDFCLAINMMDGRFSYAVYADAKRQPNLGESSMRLVDNLGLPSGRQGGATRGVMFLVFPNSGIGQGSIPLDEELQFIEKYLEQVRFSDRLQVRWSIASEVRDALVPEFILQPLVENAIRHGIAKGAEAGLIEITACESDSEVVLSIQDNGPGYHPMSDAGVGLANMRARLATLFGETGRLEVVNAEGDGATATVLFPLRRRGDG